MAVGDADVRPEPIASSRLLAQCALLRDSVRECDARALWVNETNAPNPNCRAASRSDRHQRIIPSGNSPSRAPSVGRSNPRLSADSVPGRHRAAFVASNHRKRGPRLCLLDESSRYTPPLVSAFPVPGFFLCRCNPPNAPATVPRPPFFEPHVALQRLLHFAKRLGHSHARRTQWTSLTVVEDATNRCTII